ncbi:MAG: hypothetical protein RLZZ381_1645, partial [Cyanobacteriota bacterium]
MEDSLTVENNVDSTSTDNSGSTENVTGTETGTQTGTETGTQTGTEGTDSLYTGDANTTPENEVSDSVFYDTTNQGS